MESPHQFNTYSPFYSFIGAIFVPNLALSAGLTRLVLTPVVTGIFHALSLPLATVLVNPITRTQLIDSSNYQVVDDILFTGSLFGATYLLGQPLIPALIAPIIGASIVLGLKFTCIVISILLEKLPNPYGSQISEQSCIWYNFNA